MTALAPYNVSLASVSPFFIYSPTRDGDASITWNSSYTGSPVWPPIANQQEPKGIPYRRTLSAAATMDFSYLGADVHLCLMDGGASYTLAVDGASVKTATSQGDAACDSYPAETVLLSSSGVQMGNHNVHLKVTASSAKEFRFFGAVVTMGVTSGSTHVLEKLVDDQDAAWTMVPGRGGADAWQSGSDLEINNLINDGHSWTCIYDSVNTQSASYTFTGAGGVLLRGTVGMGLEVYSVDFDGEHTDLDATSVWPDPSGVVLFMRGGLDPKKRYTITLNNYNENYPTCDKLYYLPPSQHLLACCANLDGLVLLGDGGGTAAPLPQPPSSPHNGSAPQSPPTPPADATPVTPAQPLKDPGPSNGSGTSSASALTPTSPPGHRQNVRAVVGASLGGAFCAIIIVLAASVVYFRLRRKRLSSARQAQPLPFASPPSRDMLDLRRDSASLGTRQPSQVRRNKLYALASAASIPKPETSAATTTDVSSSAPFGTESLDPSEARSTTTSSSRQRRGHMPPEVLEEVLAFVAQRMDGEASSPHRGAEPSTLPPRYRW